jgi:hypothetical protein
VTLANKALVVAWVCFKANNGIIFVVKKGLGAVVTKRHLHQTTPIIKKAPCGAPLLFANYSIFFLPVKVYMVLHGCFLGGLKRLNRFSFEI